MPEGTTQHRITMGKHFFLMFYQVHESNQMENNEMQLDLLSCIQTVFLTLPPEIPLTTHKKTPQPQECVFVCVCVRVSECVCACMCVRAYMCAGVCMCMH